MDNTGYLCLMIVLKMLGIKTDSTELEHKIKKATDVDVELIRVAKELGLKVKLTKFREKLLKDLQSLLLPGVKIINIY